MRTALVLSALITLSACGARDALHEPFVDAGAPPDAGRPACLIECYAGHACCLGGCDGPPAVIDTCCACLPGEISTFECGSATCGG
jgi:hypothetical protein